MIIHRRKHGVELRDNEVTCMAWGVRIERFGRRVACGGGSDCVAVWRVACASVSLGGLFDDGRHVKNMTRNMVNVKRRGKEGRSRGWTVSGGRRTGRRPCAV